MPIPTSSGPTSSGSTSSGLSSPGTSSPGPSSPGPSSPGASRGRGSSPLTRRAALAVLGTGALALPLVAEPALADPGRGDARTEGRGDGAPSRTRGRRGHGRPTGPLAPPAEPFSPDVPAGVSADVVLAAYAQTSEDLADYGNYDLSDRAPGDIDWIVIHDTEEDYETTLRIFTDPSRGTSIHYVIRGDGHITQMVRVQDVAWHAGNWTYNARSIGIELVGFAEDPSGFTDAQYRATARLLRHLSHAYRVPLDRDHVVAHGEIPGRGAAGQAAMHWDPGAYYDWGRLFDLAGAAAPRDLRGAPPVGSAVAVVPHLATNALAFTSCDGSGKVLPSRGSSAVMLRSAPAEDAALLADPALASIGPAGTDRICDWGAQLAWGQTLAVADRRDGWTGLHVAGAIGWVRERDAAGRPTLGRAPGRTRRVRPRAGAQAHGLALPTTSAFTRLGLTAPANDPLPYALGPDQVYVVEAEHRGRYFWAKSFDAAGTRWVVDDARWVRVQLNHRSAFLRAEDVEEV